MIGPVLVHDREPLGPMPRRPGFGDVDDPAVEIGALAGEPGVDRVRAFVGGAAPLCRRDDIALPGQFGMGGDVVEIAADGERAVAVGLDEALDERLSAGSRPSVEIGRGHLGDDHAGKIRIETGDQACRDHRPGHDLVR